MESKAEKKAQELREDSPEERKRRQKRLEFAISSLLVGLLVLAATVPETRRALSILALIAFAVGWGHYEWAQLKWKLKKAERREREIYQELEKARKELAEYAERERWAREDVVN